MSLQRPALDQLGLFREGHTVLMARLFHLGRSRDHVIHLANSFHQRGIHFKALDLGIDTSTPAGKFMLSIFASLAEYDRESIWRKPKPASNWPPPRTSASAGPKSWMLRMWEM